MSLRALAIAAILGLSLATPVRALDLYCRQTGHMSWIDGVAASHGNATGVWGNSEFWLDTTNGDWNQRNFGSRALYTDGGILDVLNDGTGYGADWVGVTPELAEMVRINLRADPFPYVRIMRGHAIETGICIDPGTDKYMDGELVE